MKITILLAKRPTRLKVRLNIFLNVSTAQPKMQRTRAHRRHGPDLKAALTRCPGIQASKQLKGRTRIQFKNQGRPRNNSPAAASHDPACRWRNPGYKYSLSRLSPEPQAGVLYGSPRRKPPEKAMSAPIQDPGSILFHGVPLSHDERLRLR